MDNNKLSAVIAAVSTYISTSEEAAGPVCSEPGVQESDQAQVNAAKTQNPVQPANIWGITGRGNIMQANSMMQLRMFK